MTIECDVEVKDNIAYIYSEFEDIFFKTTNKPLNPNITFDFAVWAMLPLAMRFGANLQINGTISKSTKDSAEKIAIMWSTWVPGFYEAIKINASSVIETTPTKKGTLAFFSGGVDSTYSVLKTWKENHEKVDALTVHGMDFNVNDKEKFEALIEKTYSVRKLVFNNNYYVQTNIYNIYNRYKCNPSKKHHVTHIFTLFGAGTLFDDYQKYHVASDYPLYQQFIRCPHGNNSATNNLMRNATGYLKMMTDDVTRVEKVNYLAKNFDSYLDNISCCSNKKIRPNNCGICGKCSRTKAIFLATTGSVPPIFKEKNLARDWYKKFSPLFALGDILIEVQANGFENKIPSFKQAKRYFENGVRKEVRKRESIKQRMRNALKIFGLKTPFDRALERLKNS